MKLFTIATAASVASASATVMTELSLPGEFHKIAAKVNQMNDATWVAEAPLRFNSTADVAQLCGTWLKGSDQYLDHRLPELVTEVADEDVPSDFDARTQW